MSGPDFITEAFPAVRPDGARVTVVVRVGRPTRDARSDDPRDDTHVCRVQLEGIDDRPFACHGVGPVQALHLGLSKVQIDLEHCREALGLRFVWPDGTTRDVRDEWWNGGAGAD
ncbi:MAG TPA: hypothetical protein VEA69_18830 [Tepidisphaeraceae bacterium]|nr:hypothetical protein [Tepidisphaeraceae bacterium]